MTTAPSPWVDELGRRHATRAVNELDAERDGTAPAQETTFTAEFMKSKSINTPFINQTLKGRVELVVLGNDVLLHR